MHMTNKDKILQLMQKHKVRHAIYSSSLDFEDKCPSGDLVFAGELDSKLLSQVRELYDAEEVTEDNIRFGVWMVPEDSVNFKAFRLECKEELNADI